MEWLKDDYLAELNRLKLSLISQGESFLDLFMINPDLAPPRLMLDKLVEACLKPGNHRYAVSRGVRRLREAFCSKYGRRFGVQLSADKQVCVTMGSKDALPNALLSLRELGFGDRVLLGAPTYPAHLAAVEIAGMQCDFFSICPDPKEILSNLLRSLDSSKARIILLNFPNNPTGLRVDVEFYKKLLAEIEGKNIFVLNDFVYGEMCFDGKPAPSLLGQESSKRNVAECYSLSKAYCVAGWRVAALLGDEKLIAALAKLKSQLDYGLFLPVQFAAAAALVSQDDLVAPTVSTYWRRFSLLARGLTALGWEVQSSMAGASLWARYPEYLMADHSSGSKSLALCLRLLGTSKVLAMPGVLFGEQYDGYLRFALVVAEDQIREVLERLESFGRSAASTRESNALLGG